MSYSNWTQLVDDLLNSQDVQRVLQVVEAISKVATESHVPELYALVRHPDFFVREAAAWPLARLEGVKALPALFQAYTLGLRDGQDNDGLSATIADLLEEYKQESAPVILGMLQNTDTDVKVNAAWAAGYIAPEIPAQVLLTLLANKSEALIVRAAAAGSLASYGDNIAVVEALIEAASDMSKQVRMSAISALGYLGSKKAIQPLKAAQIGASSKEETELIKYALRQLRA